MSGYNVEVPDIGAFVFKKRSYRLQLLIEAEVVRALRGRIDDRYIQNSTEALVTLSVLTEQAPDGWDVEALDPLDPDDTVKLWKVYDALRDAEEKKRRGAK